MGDDHFAIITKVNLSITNYHYHYHLFLSQHYFRLAIIICLLIIVIAIDYFNRFCSTIAIINDLNDVNDYCLIKTTAPTIITTISITHKRILPSTLWLFIYLPPHSNTYQSIHQTTHLSSILSSLCYHPLLSSNHSPPSITIILPSTYPHVHLHRRRLHYSKSLISTRIFEQYLVTFYLGFSYLFIID